MSPSQLDEILFTSSLDLGAAGWDAYFGYGRINAEAAVNKARNYSTVDTEAPALNFNTPVAGSTVSGIVNVDILATDNIGVKSVSLAVNGDTYELTAAPYAFSFDTAGFAEGPLTLNASALDEAGNIANASIEVNVSSVPEDNIAPTVLFSNPVSGATVKGKVNVSVNATDNGKLSKVELMIDGKIVSNLITGNTSAVLNYTWTACTNRNNCSGTSTLKATAYDAANNSSSTTVQVTKKW